MFRSVSSTNIGMKMSEFESADQRRSYLEKKLNIKLGNVKKGLIDDIKDIHCENLIGAITLPLGVAGPLKLKGECVKGKFYIPLATSEGALVASVNRGCKAITMAGGAGVYAYKTGTTRGPVFFTGSLEKSKAFYIWLRKNESKLAEIGESTSSYLRLIKIDAKTLANYAFVRFYFDTADAMGMNMATFATDKIVNYIEEQTKIRCLSIAGNYDTDKKPAWINFIDNRGIKVWAEIILSKKILKDVLKTNASEFFDVWLAKCMLGSAMSGSMGFNSHFANVIAAFFAATGQDLAHTVEGSLGITTAKVLSGGDLYFSIHIPSLMLGTVGGGTNLKTKKEALSIIGVKTSLELAEVLAGAVLAGEISLLASLEEGLLAKAHKRLGR